MINMTWSEYIVTVAAPHSKNNAKHWLRYLSKDINKCGTIFSRQDIVDLYNNANNELKEEVNRNEEAMEIGVGNAALGVPG